MYSNKTLGKVQVILKHGAENTSLSMRIAAYRAYQINLQVERSTSWKPTARRLHVSSYPFTKFKGFLPDRTCALLLQ